MSSVFDSEVFCDISYDQIALSKVSGSVGSTIANTHYPDCEIFANTQDPDCDMLDASDKLMNAFSSSTHA